MLTRCEEVTGSVCADFEAELTEFDGESDHVHLLVDHPPKVAVSVLVNSLKGVSSRRLRQEFTGTTNRAIMHGRLWSPSYFAGSCGGASIEVLREYIQQRQRPARGPGRPKLMR